MSSETQNSSEMSAARVGELYTRIHARYRALLQQRKRVEADALLREFFASFQSDTEKQEWVGDFLSSREDRRKISHFIYTDLIFPVLLQGYRQNDPWSTLWLAKTIQNIYSVDAIHEAIGRKTEFQLLKEAYALSPAVENRRALLDADIRWFRYCEHEWPSGILYGSDGATRAECEGILSEVTFAKSLDAEALFTAFLDGFEQNVLLYQERLRKR